MPPQRLLRTPSDTLCIFCAGRFRLDAAPRRRPRMPAHGQKRLINTSHSANQSAEPASAPAPDDVPLSSPLSSQTAWSQSLGSSEEQARQALMARGAEQRERAAKEDRERQERIKAAAADYESGAGRPVVRESSGRRGDSNQPSQAQSVLPPVDDSHGAAVAAPTDNHIRGIAERFERARNTQSQGRRDQAGGAATAPIRYQTKGPSRLHRSLALPPETESPPRAAAPIRYHDSLGLSSLRSGQTRQDKPPPIRRTYESSPPNSEGPSLSAQRQTREDQPSPVKEAPSTASKAAEDLRSSRPRQTRQDQPSLIRRAFDKTQEGNSTSRPRGNSQHQRQAREGQGHVFASRMPDMTRSKKMPQLAAPPQKAFPAWAKSESKVISPVSDWGRPVLAPRMEYEPEEIQQDSVREEDIVPSVGAQEDAESTPQDFPSYKSLDRRPAEAVAGAAGEDASIKTKFPAEEVEPPASPDIEPAEERSNLPESDDVPVAAELSAPSKDRESFAPATETDETTETCTNVGRDTSDVRINTRQDEDRRLSSQKSRRMTDTVTSMLAQIEEKRRVGASPSVATRPNPIANQEFPDIGRPDSFAPAVIDMEEQPSGSRMTASRLSIHASPASSWGGTFATSHMSEQKPAADEQSSLNDESSALDEEEERQYQALLAKRMKQKQANSVPPQNQPREENLSSQEQQLRNALLKRSRGAAEEQKSRAPEQSQQYRRQRGSYRIELNDRAREAPVQPFDPALTSQWNVLNEKTNVAFKPLQMTSPEETRSGPPSPQRTSRLKSEADVDAKFEEHRRRRPVFTPHVAETGPPEPQRSRREIPAEQQICARCGQQGHTAPDCRGPPRSDRPQPKRRGTAVSEGLSFRRVDLNPKTASHRDSAAQGHSEDMQRAKRPVPWQSSTAIDEAEQESAETANVKDEGSKGFAIRKVDAVGTAEGDATSGPTFKSRKFADDAERSERPRRARRTRSDEDEDDERPRRGRRGVFAQPGDDMDDLEGAPRRGRRAAEEEDDDDGDYESLREAREDRKRTRQARKSKASREADKKAAQKARRSNDATPIKLPEFVSVARLAQMLGVRFEDFVHKLERLGFANTSHDHVLSAENAGLIAMEYNFDPNAGDVLGEEEDDRDLKARPAVEDAEFLPTRPPIVAIMGHVDHGKTTILDYLRSTSVAATEHGGITQHIGAFSVPLSSGRTITFLDTPGHAAFLSMRQRGATVTDIVILVVAADDSVKPQTLEALKHARDANVPIIVAINKIDKEEANVERVKQDLARHGVEIEDFGGDTQVVCVSGKTGEGMEELEEAAVTLSEILDHRAETTGPVEGWVLEATTKKAGRLATVLVRRGTLMPGNIVVAGKTWTRVRTLHDEAGRIVTSAGPGTPVETDGWRDQPAAGDEVLQAPSEQKATDVVAYRQELEERIKMAGDMDAINDHRRLEQEKRERDKAAAEAAASAAKSDDAATDSSSSTPSPSTAASTSPDEPTTGHQSVPFIIKADVSGSVEAVSAYLLQLTNALVSPTILRAGVGAVAEFDVAHAAAAGGHIISFNLAADAPTVGAAAKRGVRVLEQNVIYRIVDDVREVLEAKLPPLRSQRVVGEADVAAGFEIGVGGRRTVRIAGCRVRNGMVGRGSRVRVLRGGVKVYDGMLSSLKNVKKDVAEMRKGTECGMGFDGWEAFEVGDQIQTYEEKVEKRTLQI